MAADRFKIQVTPTIDTAVYADLDRLGSVATLANIAQANGGHWQIDEALLEDDAASNFSIEAHFWGVSPTLANADNGVFDITDANEATGVYLGYLDFLAAHTRSFSTSNRHTLGSRFGGLPILSGSCESSTTSAFMTLRARGAYDAVATDDLRITLRGWRFS